MSDCTDKHLIIACGGTGGHLFPGIAVAEAWTRRGGDVLLLISEKQIDALASEGYDHLRFERMPAIAMPGVLSPKMPGFVLGFLKGLRGCRRLVREFEADAVLGMGGFTSAAPLVAGRMKKLPTFIHESNAIPGRANKLNAKFAESVLVGFEDCSSHFASGKNVQVVGTPLRPSVAKKPNHIDALKHYGLDPEKKTFMVMGGSQGAHRINELVASGLAQFSAAGIQVLHISGPSDYESIKPFYDKNPDAGVLLDFCSDVQFAYAASDLAICRSGASSLTEIAHYELPSVLIPYPFAADDHQTRNAEIFSGPGAAQLWTQGELSEENFATKTVELMNDEVKMAEMKKVMKELAIPDASDRVCDVILSAV